MVDAAALEVGVATSPPRSGFTVGVQGERSIEITGELDCVTAPTLEMSLDRLTRVGADIIIDLAKLNFLGAAGINAIAAAVHDLGERGRVVLRNPPTAVARIIELTGFDRLVEVTYAPPGDAP